MSECLALEYRNKGITFCTLYPSAVSTKMIHNANQDFMTVSPAEYVRSSLGSIRYRQSVHISGCMPHMMLESLVSVITFFTSKRTVGLLIELCSLGYKRLVIQMETNGNAKKKAEKPFHMWNVLTQNVK